MSGPGRTLNAAMSEKVEEAPAGSGERIGVEGWRLRCLLEAGWPVAKAEALAADPEVDLHRACAILKTGCDVDTAWRIYSPLRS